MNTIRQQLNWPMGIIIALLIPITAGQSVNFTDCGKFRWNFFFKLNLNFFTFHCTGDGNVNEVRIYPCSTTGGSTACTIKLGTNVTVEADFVASKYSRLEFKIV